ncbi:MAG: helix-turn-helix domain-containing protein [Candidatus Uhrbacteria bacterium]
MNDPILSTLVSVGLTDKEARVYVALLSMSRGTASTIAERAGIKRSIAYFTLDSLVERGYAQELPGHKVKRYSAVEPARLLTSVQANAENLRMMLPLLRGLFQGPESKATVEIHEGKEAILPVYRMMESGRSSFYMTNWEKLYEFFPEETQRWGVAAANEKNPNVTKNLIVDSSAGRDIMKKMSGNKKQSFRFLPKDRDYQMNFGISDNVLAITSFEPMFAVVIRSEQVVAAATLLFDLAWESAKKPAAR